MKLDEIYKDNMNKKGVYQIKNLINNKVYIGSTTRSFKLRLKEHIVSLSKNKHKNQYLQNAWNKYSQDYFEFTILEVCDENDIIKFEQFWIDSTTCYNSENGYNINPLADRISTKEVYEKRRQTMLRKYASGELDHVREKSRKIGDRKRGVKLEDTSHLKVPKTITNKVLESRELRKKEIRNKLPKVYVYDSNMNFIQLFQSIPDLIDYSKTETNNLPIKSRFPNGRVFNGKIIPTKYLKESNIHMSISNKTPYKSLYFSYLPLHQETDVEKLGKNGEV